jgi:hypothetical protein
MQLKEGEKYAGFWSIPGELWWNLEIVEENIIDRRKME